MDNPSQVSQPITPTSPSPVTPPAPKRNLTLPIIIFLIIGASIITGLAYIFLTPSGSKKLTQITNIQSPAPNPHEKTRWDTYTNTQYQYSFFYPINWEITSTASNQKNFELRYKDGSGPAAIKINFYTENERITMKKTYCEQNENTSRCRAVKLTKKITALLDRPTQTKNANPSALIFIPDSGALSIEMTDNSSDSYYAFGIILDSLSFPNEKRSYTLQLCPDSWPASGENVDYNGVKIPTKDIDAAWVKTNCQYP